MPTHKSNSSLSQKVITLLLILKLMLIGAQADKRIQQGDTLIEVLMWVINQCVPVLQQVDKSVNKQKQGDTHKYKNGHRIIK
jgi:hypothetical protein